MVVLRELELSVRDEDEAPADDDVEDEVEGGGDARVDDDAGGRGADARVDAAGGTDGGWEAVARSGDLVPNPLRGVDCVRDGRAEVFEGVCCLCCAGVFTAGRFCCCPPGDVAAASVRPNVADGDV